MGQGRVCCGVGEGVCCTAFIPQPGSIIRRKPLPEIIIFAYKHKTKHCSTTCASSLIIKKRKRKQKNIHRKLKVTLRITLDFTFRSCRACVRMCVYVCNFLFVLYGVSIFMSYNSLCCCALHHAYESETTVPH